jgi:hypothetical protein
MNEEKTGKSVQQVKHIRSHLCHRYSITVNQVMVATVKPGATSGAGIAYPSGAPEFTPRFLVGFVLLDL